MVIKRRLFLLALFFLTGMASDCPKKEEEPYQERFSSIYAAKLFYENLETIRLDLPRVGSKIYDWQGKRGGINFTFSTAGYTNGMILLFSKLPSRLTFQKDIDSNCLAGVTSMAGHYWGSSLSIEADSVESQFYKCQKGNKLEVLHPTEKVYLDSETADGEKIFRNGESYYWVVLGYTQDYVLTHASPVYEFRLEE